MAEFDSLLTPVLEQDPRYARAAYHFVREALDHAQTRLQKAGEDRPRHVSAQELLEGIREYALTQFGPMSCLVFDEWGVRTCADFGEIVFNMIEAQILSKTEADSRDDFRNGFDFVEAFRRPFAPQQAELSRG
ncbi:MAG TPA: hypothetical protein PLX89_14535 [Verrucomicrobiota bacterium]|nr:hypothetical protein [Verrucomicrobiales bacterium]HRI14210.1 hypothetical protein [Verrucomicrobiota bacterium]